MAVKWLEREVKISAPTNALFMNCEGIPMFAHTLSWRAALHFVFTNAMDKVQVKCIKLSL
jgi:hypothetical protein